MKCCWGRLCDKNALLLRVWFKRIFVKQETHTWGSTPEEAGNLEGDWKCWTVVLFLRFATHEAIFCLGLINFVAWRRSFLYVSLTKTFTRVVHERGNYFGSCDFLCRANVRGEVYHILANQHQACRFHDQYAKFTRRAGFNEKSEGD